MKDINKIILPHEASKILGISPRAVQQNCEKGKYICRKAGRIWLIDKASLKPSK